MARHDAAFPSAPSAEMRRTVQVINQSIQASDPDEWIDFRALMESKRFKRAGLFLPREMLEQWKDANF